MATIDTSKAISKVTVEGIEVQLQGSSGEDMLQARVYATNSCYYLFYQYPNTTMIDISKLDTSNVTNMGYMFGYCKASSLDLSSFDTSNVTNMTNMFYQCTNLTNLDLSSFDTSNVTNMSGMFSGCAFTSLDLSSFDTSNVTNMGNMFSSCPNLTTIIGTINMQSMTNSNNMSNMLYNCPALTTFTLKNIQRSITIGNGTSYGTLLDDPTITNIAMELIPHKTTQQKLTVSTVVSAKLDTIYVKLIDVTDEMIANDPYITDKKPFVVCESTDESAMTLREYIVSKNWTISG